MHFFPELKRSENGNDDSVMSNLKNKKNESFSGLFMKYNMVFTYLNHP